MQVSASYFMNDVFISTQKRTRFKLPPLCFYYFGGSAKPTCYNLVVYQSTHQSNGKGGGGGGGVRHFLSFSVYTCMRMKLVSCI